MCGCESEQDFAAKLWCLRQAFDRILEDQTSRKWIIATGRNIIADLLRQDKKDPHAFYVAYDRLIEYVEKAENRAQIEGELRLRMVKALFSSLQSFHQTTEILRLSMSTFGMF